jgi:SAM-dependent methyltransferase
MNEKDIYNNWHQRDSIERFAKKDVSQFFKSETWFLQRIGPELRSVLDIGCASGRFIDLVENYSRGFTYTGVDLVPESIEIGRQMYPQADFYAGSALDFTTEKKFDLVNATGVFQHEPAYGSLLSRMLGWSDKYVLFDVKVAPIEVHLVDINRAYCQREHDRMYFNVLSWARFREELLALGDIERIEVYGYETRPNKVTVVPDEILPFASMGVLLTKGKKPVELDEQNLPDFLKAGQVGK